MKQILISLASGLLVITAVAQKIFPEQSNYEAANWKTWLFDATQVKIGSAPTTAQSRAELLLVRKQMNNLDAKSREQFTYWNAGAPSYRWNQVVLGLVDQKPDVMLRFPAAWMNLAIYDATILAWQEKVKYKRLRPAQLDASLKTFINAPTTYAYPCEHSVTAAAAAYVLAYFFPAKADSILAMAHAASQSRISAGVQFPSDTEAGWKLGEQVAKQIIEQAKNDGSTKKWDGNMNRDPKKWTGQYPMGITLGSFTPMVIKSADQFRLPAPPDFEEDMKELKNFKRTNKTNYIAWFWANNGPNFWNDLASVKMFETHMMDDAPAAARVYTLLAVAYHDVAIAVFDTKYTYWGIRPNQYDSTYKSFISTPPFPGYPSGHAATGAGQSAVLSSFFPADAKQFEELAQECANSRFYAGIHFRTDNESALKMGHEIGKYIVDTWMAK